MKHEKHEFDKYIKNYRENLDKSLWLSGESSTFFAEYKAAKLKEWFPLQAQQEQTILDFGCGDGLMTSFVNVFFPKANVYGVDPSSESINVAHMAYPNITFSVSDTQIEFEDHFFDMIFTAGAFHHIPFIEHEHYLSEIYRILKPGGYFILFELNPLNPLTAFTFKRNPIDKNAKMMFPWYSKKLLTMFGNPSIKFYCFFPRLLRKLRFLEPYLTQIPLGALYAIIVQKKSDVTHN